jgi:GH25 family lysozyme M1 (1,4-beta-N-acetylmuramidase)
MIEICPRCGGKEVGCPTCHLPPKRQRPKQPLLASLRNRIYLPIILKSQSWPVQGVDLSSWNGVMDLSITKTKAQYGFFRVGYGEGYKDYRCDTYRRDALNNDWPYGIYWFCYPQYSWLKHAQAFAEVANEFPYQLDMVIDAETTTLGRQATLDWFVNLDNKLQELTGKKPIIYTSMGFWDDKVARSTHFTARRNWVAHWTTAQSPLLPLDMPLYGHWQHLADGNKKATEYGMIKEGDPDMDLDRANDSVESFNARYGTHIKPLSGDIPTNPIVPKKYIIVNTAALNIRSLPDATSKDIGTIRYGDDVPVTEESNGWYKIEGWISGYYTKPK